jgi:hypothetical protein
VFDLRSSFAAEVGGKMLGAVTVGSGAATGGSKSAAVIAGISISALLMLCSTALVASGKGASMRGNLAVLVLTFAETLFIGLLLKASSIAEKAASAGSFVLFALAIFASPQHAAFDRVWYRLNASSTYGKVASKQQNSIKTRVSPKS